MKNSFKLIGKLSFPFLVLAAVLLLPLNSSQVNAATKTRLTITKKVTSLKAGKSVKLKAAVTQTTDGVTKTLSGKGLTWSVSNSSIASISKSGTLTGKKVGTVAVTATYKDKRKTIKVSITPKKVIGIDAGHQLKGNSELERNGPGSKVKKPKVSSGTCGVATKVNEYELNLTIALKLKTELENRGYKVVMTRTTHDVDISNRERAIMLNKSGCDISIRLHADGSTNRNKTGASALYTSTSNPYVDSKISKKSKRLAKTILDAYCEQTSIKNNGIVVRDDLTGNNYSKIPTFVLEMGYMSNSSEDRNMQKKTTQKNMVKGIANGIDAYFS